MYQMHSKAQTRTAYGGILSGSKHPANSQNRLRKTVLLLGLFGFTVLLPQFELWAADSPASCPSDFEVESIALTDWETGLGAWTVDTYDVAQPGTFDTPDWATVGSLPDSRPGAAAFVENVNEGNCTSDDETGVLTLTSPIISIPVQAEGPRIALNHWFDIEYGWDGGNLKISTNGGPFTLVPGSAFETGPYTDVLFEAVRDFLPYNSNPLAEQEAFTGSGLQLDGASWAQSRVNLDGIAGPGDSIQLRFDFGVDGCDGAVGWYVDEVDVYSCISDASAVCGDGVVEGAEQCDDGDVANGDGCSASCMVEDGWSCNDASPSMCSQNSTGTNLTLVKEVSNNNGGISTPSDWTLTATGPTGFSGRGPTVQSPVSFEAGTYDLSESGDISGYRASNWSCSGATILDADTVTITEGSNATCTVTNFDRAPSLTLVKEVINDDGGTASASDWVLSASGPTGFSGPGPSVESGSNFSAGTYTLSESGGPAGYVGGGWSCNGGNQIDGNTVEIGLGETATCVVTNDDFDSNTAINVGHNGAWYNPETPGQGLLFDIDPVTEYMFVAWFTFTEEASAEPYEQRWLTAQGEYSGNQAELVLYETLGGEFNDPTVVATLPIGTLTLVFGGCEDAQATYRIETEGLEGAFPLARAIPDSATVCKDLVSEASTETDFSTQSIEINSGLDGAWYDVNTPGQGYLFDARPDPINGNFLFIAWFTFGELNASGQWWLTVQGVYDTTPADVLIYESTGGSFDDPRPVDTLPIGEMQVDFIDCNNATLTFDIPDRGLQDQVIITRVLPGTEELCQQIVDAD